MQRTKNFTSSEKSHLLNIIFLYRHIIENKKTDNITNLQKEEAWTNISVDYNKNKTDFKSEKSLRRCWENIKKEAKKYCAMHKREMYKTGGGVITIEKNELFERAREILGEIRINGLSNPFDSDYIELDRNVQNISTIENISQDEDDNILQEDTNDSMEVFSYLVKNKKICDWKTWDPKKLKSKKSFPLRTKDTTPTTSKNVNPLEAAKIELIHILQTNEKEKKNYEIELLKSKPEKEKLEIELLRLRIEKEKTIIEDRKPKSWNVNTNLRMFKSSKKI